MVIFVGLDNVCHLLFMRTLQLIPWPKMHCNTLLESLSEFGVPLIEIFSVKPQFS